MDGVAGRGWLTWPNLITVLRLACLPIFVVLVATTNHWAAAAWLLAALGSTDWIDGHLARRLHQVSEVGKVLDPVADRLLVITGVFTIAAVGAVPWWFAGLTIAREAIVSGVTLALAALGAARIDVLWWGKVSTFALMSAYPMFLLTTNPTGATRATWQLALRDATWCVGAVGLAIAWVVLAGYVRPSLAALRRGRAARALQ